MAYYNNNNKKWSGAPGNNTSRETMNQTPRQSGPATTTSPKPAFDAHRPRSAQAGAVEDGQPFYYQFASIDRAVEIWQKSSSKSGDPRVNLASRFQPRVEFDPMRGLPNGPPQGPPQGFYAPGPPPPQSQGPPQRFGGARSNEPDPAVQAKRRMAAQRERELRNYHQDQQFHKHLPGAKSDRSMSPNTAMSENERRDLIARQHRALYGEDSTLYSAEPAQTRGSVSQDARVSQRQARSRRNSNTSPTASPIAYENPQSQEKVSPRSSPPRDTEQSSTTAGGSVAPIGTRPASTQQQSGGSRRATPPSASPLYGFSGEQAQGEGAAAGQEDKSGNSRGGWGNSGPWGAKGALSAQAKVWG